MVAGRSTEDVLSVGPARGLAATLDLDPARLREGDPLPAGWHWIYFHEAVKRSELGDDGHERRGEFLPDLGLPRRMWAGGRLRFHRPLRIGERALRSSTVGSVERKEGRTGQLAFVTVHHRIVGEDGRLSVDEEQDLVYLEEPDGARSQAGSDPGPTDPTGDERLRPAPDAHEPSEWSETFEADEVTLFRFSALTFNGHRIHYDRRYATDVEGYPDLVVHGPLLALLLLGAGLRRAGADALARRFEYQALRPLFCNEEVRVTGRTEHPAAGGEADEGIVVLAEHPVRGVAMRATLGVTT